jgi:hypothetical protein
MKSGGVMPRPSFIGAAATTVAAVLASGAGVAPAAAKPAHAKPAHAKPAQAKPAQAKPAHKRSFSAVLVGAQISTNGNRFETVYRVIRSPDGGGAAIQDGVLLGTTYPVTGNDTMRLYYADGVQHVSDTFSRGAPRTDGIGAITGKGTCTTGSGLHKGQTCTYTITGSYDLNTGVTKLRFAGTFTR